MPTNTIEPTQPEKPNEKQIRQQKIDALNKAMMEKPGFRRVLRTAMLLHTNTQAQYFDRHTTANETNSQTSTVPKKLR